MLLATIPVKFRLPIDIGTVRFVPGRIRILRFEANGIGHHFIPGKKFTGLYTEFC